jgi:serine protease
VRYFTIGPINGSSKEELPPEKRLYEANCAIVAAIASMSAGDVLLLETQFWPRDDGTPLPAEVRAAIFDSIRLGSALGIVMVEPAGNGWQDLDTLTDTGGRQALNRHSAGFQDSGALMVGAARSTVPHSRLASSNFGSRVDCYAWGEAVDTLTTDPTGTATDRYTSYFGGTSAAAAILAGAALIVQSAAQARLGFRLSPRQLRAVLSDPAHGTASSDPAVDQIGVMPDLRKILQNLRNVTADL